MADIIKHFVTGLEFDDVFISGKSIAIGTDAPAVDSRLEISGDTNQSLIDAMNGNISAFFVSGEKVGIRTRDPKKTVDINGYLFINSGVYLSGQNTSIFLKMVQGEEVTGHFVSNSNEAGLFLDADIASMPAGDAYVKFRTNEDSNKAFIIGARNSVENGNIQSFVMTTGLNIDVGIPTIEIKNGFIGIKHNAAATTLDISGSLRTSSNITGTTITGTTMLGAPAVRGDNFVFTSMSGSILSGATIKGGNLVATIITGGSLGVGIGPRTIQSVLEVSGASNASLLDIKHANATPLFISGSKIGILTRVPITTLDIAGSFSIHESNGPATGHLLSANAESSIFLDADVGIADPPSDATLKFRTCSTDNAGFIMGAHNLFDGFVQEFTMTTGQSINISQPTFKIKVGKIGIMTNNPVAQLHVSGTPTSHLLRVGTGALDVSGVYTSLNMRTPPAHIFNVSGDAMISGDIHIPADANIYKGGTAYNNPFSLGHSYSEGEWMSHGDALILVGNEVFRSTKAKDRRCIGIYAETVGAAEHSIFGSITKVAKTVSAGDSFIYEKGHKIVPGLKICNEGGPIEAGQWLTTSDQVGYLQRQNDSLGQYDNIFRDYTVAKCFEDIDFSGYNKVDNIYGYLVAN